MATAAIFLLFVGLPIGVSVLLGRGQMPDRDTIAILIVVGLCAHQLMEKLEAIHRDIRNR
jgi:hypothetical protein